MPEKSDKPVEASVEKVNGEVAVGEDLDFQRRWWRFERCVWMAFVFILILDLLGAFGRGPLAHAHAQSPDGMLNVKYDRIQRTGAPSMLDVSFNEQAIHDGKLRLFVSESLVKALGAQRVVPHPEETQVGWGGLTYTFPATAPPALVEFELQPSVPGVFYFQMGAVGGRSIERRVAVMP